MTGVLVSCPTSAGVAVTEIEQALANAGHLPKPGLGSDRVSILLITDGSGSVRIVAQTLRDQGVRAITCWREEVRDTMDKPTEPTEEQLAGMTPDELEAYADTLNATQPEPRSDRPQPLVSVVSVRFALGEVETLRQRADAAGMRLTAYIREMSLREAGDSVDLCALRELGEAEQEL